MANFLSTISAIVAPWIGVAGSAAALDAKTFYEQQERIGHTRD
jgi:hypothetical protein